MDIPIYTCHFFSFFKNILKPNFFGKIDWSMNFGRQRAGNN